FTDRATEFARDPTIKTYLAIRTDFPELDIHIGASGGLRAFMGLMSKFEDFDLDLSLITGAMAGFEPDVDRLCLDLMRKIVGAEKAGPLDRYQVAESRPRKVPRTVVNFLFGQILEAFDYD